MPIGEGQVLAVAASSEAGAWLDANPQGFCIALQAECSLPDWLERHAGRCCVVSSGLEPPLFFAQVQGIFARQALWLATLQRAAAAGAGIQGVLDACAHAFEGFIYVYDEAGSIIASHGSTLAVFADVASGIEAGVASGDLVMDRWEMDLEPVADAPSAVWLERRWRDLESSRLCAKLNIGARQLTMVQVLPVASPNAGAQALFALFAEELQAQLLSASRQAVLQALPRGESQPHYALFERLLAGEQLRVDYIAQQASRLNIPQEADFKLLLLEPLPAADRLLLSRLMDNAAKLNDGRCLVYPHAESLLILCFCQGSDSGLSTRRLEEEAGRLLFGPFKTAAFASQVFNYLKDLELAYKQAIISMDFRETIDAQAPQGRMGEGLPYYAFEDALVFWLISQKAPDERLLAFSLSHTILEKIHAEDALNGTDDVSLLWFYLYFERKVSAVAEHMHMHRNTVLYRVERIMRRFDLDFSEQGIRDRLLLDYKVHFLVTTGKHHLARRLRKGANF
jgi:hypothetical protein